MVPLDRMYAKYLWYCSSVQDGEDSGDDDGAVIGAVEGVDDGALVGLTEGALDDKGPAEQVSHNTLHVSLADSRPATP